MQNDRPRPPLLPYAAARNGDFFRSFAYMPLQGQYPLVSLIALGLLTSAFCFLDWQSVISAAVCVRIGVQFIGQIVGLYGIHTCRPEIRLPFRMWFYPLPSLIALGGWIFVLATDRMALALSLGVILSGVVVFALWRPRPLKLST